MLQRKAVASKNESETRDARAPSSVYQDLTKRYGSLCSLLSV